MVVVPACAKALDDCSYENYKGNSRIIHFQQTEDKHVFINFHEHNIGWEKQYTLETMKTFVKDRKDLIEAYLQDIRDLKSILKNEKWNIQDYFIELSPTSLDKGKKVFEVEGQAFTDLFKTQYPHKFPALIAYKYDKYYALKEIYPDLKVHAVENQDVRDRVDSSRFMLNSMIQFFDEEMIRIEKEGSQNIIFKLVKDKLPTVRAIIHETFYILDDEMKIYENAMNELIEKMNAFDAVSLTKEETLLRSTAIQIMKLSIRLGKETSARDPYIANNLLEFPESVILTIGDAHQERLMELLVQSCNRVSK